jgi:UDP-glucuronate 4-epimerase
MGDIRRTPARALQHALDIAYAVETGTWRGETARWLARYFEHVWTIEIDDAPDLDDVENLTLVQGDSRHELARVLDILDAPALLWLDAHWCAGAGHPRPDCECPLREELKAIRPGDYVLIDDANYFTNGDPSGEHSREQWPALDEIEAALPDGYELSIHRDVIIAVPPAAVKMVEDWIANDKAGHTLVTGGAGFIGSHLCSALLENGEPVVCLDNFCDFDTVPVKLARAEKLKRFPYFMLEVGDICDPGRIFAEYNIRRVAHLAALAGVRESVRRPNEYILNNAYGTAVLFDAAQRSNVEIFVNASTSSVYGETDMVPFREDDAADRPLAAYPASKRAGELVAHAFHHLHGMNVTNLRLFNVYGPDGRRDMMPFKVLDAIYKGKEIVLYNGGRMQRDWTYIDDIVDGLMAALGRPLGYEIINLGRGEPVEMVEFVRICEGLVGKEAIIVNVPAPASDPHGTYCDLARARELLDFNPVVDIKCGLAATWEWYKQEFGIKEAAYEIAR